MWQHSKRNLHEWEGKHSVFFGQTEKQTKLWLIQTIQLDKNLSYDCRQNKSKSSRRLMLSAVLRYRELETNVQFVEVERTNI